MNIWSCKLTDPRSARLRFLVSLADSIALLIIFWFVRHSWREVAVLAGAFCYLSVLGLALDSWRLRNPGAPKQRERHIALCYLVPLFVGIIVVTFLVT